MNWKEIKEKFPKAVKTHFAWVGDNSGSLMGVVKARDLFDFFDENGIIVMLEVISIIEDISYSYKIYRESKYQEWYSERALNEFTSRAEAETEAFNKAFEILEIKLT